MQPKSFNREVVMFTRFTKLSDVADDSIFLFGARQTGKTTLIKSLFPHARYYDLLQSNEYERLSRSPWLLREELENVVTDEPIIIDEIQKIPALLDEVHWLIANKGLRFILTGSSARKLRRGGANLLGGRALWNQLFPLVSAEIDDFDLDKAINNGMLPRHYLASNAKKRLQGYVGVYLKEEIMAESVVRNQPSFNRFLEAAALTSGEMVVYNNIANDCGVSAKTVKEYFNILVDTMFGYYVPAYSKTVKRRLIQAPRFYLFDVGVTNYLLKRGRLEQGSPEYGHALEQLLILEMLAYNYTDSEAELSYWRTSSNIEVDAVLGDAKVAIEIKSTKEAQSKDTKGLKVFSEEHPQARLILVSHDARPRLHNGVEVMPVKYFLSQLWSGKIV